MVGIIYKATNKVNGMVYVGRTYQTLNERMRKHVSEHNTYFDKAIDKYGIDAFDVEVIDQADTKEELYEKEIFYISKYNCIKPNGYNLCIGGKTTKGFHHSDASKQKMSEAKSKMYIGEGNPFYGKTHTDNAKAKISESKKYDKNCTARKVRCIETGEVFDCILYAAEKYDIKPTHISRVCRGKRKTTGGFHWEYSD